jgi:hypothetical protein
MVRRLLVVVGAVALTASIGCGADSTTTDTQQVQAATETASPRQLSNAYGEIVGVCLGAELTGEGLKFKERAEMRDQLHVLTDTFESDPLAKSSDGMTAEEILFDLIPTLEECDPPLALEAEAAVGL